MNFNAVFISPFQYVDLTVDFKGFKLIFRWKYFYVFLVNLLQHYLFVSFLVAGADLWQLINKSRGLH